MTRRDYEYIVLGLGGLGSAAAYWLSRQAGADVLGLEQFELGHVRGESQDHSRIIRLSYHAPGYVELARRAYAAWDELGEGERRAGHSADRGLDFAPRVSAIPLESYSESMTAAGVAVRAPRRRRDHAALAAVPPDGRHPRLVSGGERDRDGRRANAAHQRMAREHGATLARAGAGERHPFHRAARSTSRRAADATGAGGSSSPPEPWSNGALAISASSCRSR